MGRWLALLSTASLILGAAVIDPCKRQPFRGRCPSVESQTPKRSQFVLRYYARNGECVSYPYGHCASDDSEPQLYRYKEECEDSCINNTPENLGQPKTEESQTYGTVSPLKEPATVDRAEHKVVTSERFELTTELTSVTAPPTTASTTKSTTITTTEEVTTTEATTTESTTTEKVTTTAKATTTVEATTDAPTTIKHDPKHTVTEKGEPEEEEENNVEEEVQETTAASTTAQTSTTSTAKTECERRLEASASSKIRGGFVPVCDSNGSFQKVQCEPDGRQCFCVSANGIEITNSRTRNGVKPDCARIETAVSPRTQVCTGRSDRGPCSSAYTRFYFDESTQKCNTFSFSGCGGNGNNYETEAECNRRCMPAKPATTTAAPIVIKTNDICSLPKERGPCDKYELRFYYNSDTKECKYFFWGGCEGNGNNFETAESCQSACGVAKVSQHNPARTFSQNSGPIKTIPGVRIGNGSHDELEVVTTQATSTTAAPTPSTTRFVSQPVTNRAPVPPQPQPQTTQRFVQPTTAAPKPPSTAAPVTPPRPQVVLPGDDDADSANRCAHPLDSGSCRGTFVRWFWDNRKSACDVFTYSGCEGNGNNFASNEECMAICHKELATPPPAPDFSNVCKHDIDAGECQGVFQRFAFDTEEDECRPFTYGGCGGNGNNFATIAECRTKCEKPQDQTVNVCEFEIEAGECTGVFPRFAYDRETNDCRSFTYGGCGGNGNNFANINECRNICIRKSCQPVGQCDLGRCQIVNDNRGCPFCSCSPVKLPVPNFNCPTLDIHRCQDPCIVITNRRGCQECTCPKLPSTLVPPVELPEGRAPGFHTPQTALPPATPDRVGPPASPSRPSEPVRTPMTIPGIQENKPALPNSLAELTEKCLQPMESGPCKNFVDRWFFNKEDGTCHPFKYGGCAGNRNHFFTQRECEIHCARFLNPLAPNELTTSTSHEHDARDSSQELIGTRERLGKQRALAFDLPSVLRGQQSLQVEPNIDPTHPETYETLAPIRIDQSSRHGSSKPAYTTADPRSYVQEYTTDGIFGTERHRINTVLPVVGYTRTQFTTKDPADSTHRASLPPRSESIEEEEPVPIKTTPHPTPNKKVPLRQEAAPTQTRHSGSLTPQSTYTMHAVTNYDPQGNANLEGLSPPVDPTYFTYNSQHLGQRKQFAVNNVPFDKNAPSQAGFVTLNNRPHVVQSEAERRFETALAHPQPDDEGVSTGNVPQFPPQLPQFTQAPVSQLPQQFARPPQQQFVQQRLFVPQQTVFVPARPVVVNTPVPRFVKPSQFIPQQQAPRFQAQPSPPQTNTFRTQDSRVFSPPVPTVSQPRATAPPVFQQSTRPSVQNSQTLTRVSSDHFGSLAGAAVPRSQVPSRFDPQEPVKPASSLRHSVANSLPNTSVSFRPAQQDFNQRQPPRVVSAFEEDSEEDFSTESVRILTQTTRGRLQQVTELPRVVLNKNTGEPIRQLFHPVQSAVKILESQDKLPLGTLPIHKIEPSSQMVPKRIVFKEGGAVDEREAVVHGIRNGPYGQTHWVYYDGDYYGPLIPGIKINKTQLDRVDATIAVKEDPATRRAYESFKEQASDFHKSLASFIKQKEEEQAKREKEALTTSTSEGKHPQGVVVIPLEGVEDESLLLPVVRTENTRFKATNKDYKITTDKGEASDETSEEEEEVPRRRIVAARVSQHHDVQPLPVENYKSPEPPLRGAYGKKFLEPATTQGVKIVTSTARPSTITTTPTITTTKATTTTTQVEENVPEEGSEEMEEEEPEVTITTATTTTTEAVPVVEAKKKTVQAEIDKIVNDQDNEEEEKKEARNEEEDEEPQEIPESTTVAPVTTSRATRLSAEVTTPEEVEDEKTETEEIKSESTKASEKPSSPESSPTTITSQPEVETTLVNEVNSMEGEEGIDDNEITPPSMQSSSKFAVHRQTEEVRRFEEFSADAKTIEPVSVDQTPQPLLKKVEITRPTTADLTSTAPTTVAPSTEAATQTTATPTPTAEQSTAVEKVALNIEITESTTAASRNASTEAPTTRTTHAPTMSTTTQARPTPTEADIEGQVPDFNENDIKKEQAGVLNVAVEPEIGIGRQPIPIGSVNLPDNTDDIDLKGLEEPTTIFPVTKGAPTVRPTTSQAPTTRVTLPVVQNTQAQTIKKFDSHDPRIICAMSADPGICDSYVGRWFFNSETGQCEQFSFGGCGGNLNNFVNRTLCELSCMTAHPAFTSQVPERCSYDKDAGYGKGYNVKWYFNMRNLRCEQFVFEGKGGNSNQFETLSDCERFCSPQPARTQTIRPTLPTIATIPTALPVITRPPQTVAPAPVPTTAPLPPRPLAPLPIETTTEENDEYVDDGDDAENLPSMDNIPVSSGLIPPPSLGNEVARAPGTEPQPPAAQAAKTVTHKNAVDANKLNTVSQASKAAPTPVKVTPAPTVATTQKVEQTTYKTERINTDTAFRVDPNNLLANLPIVGPSPREDVNYQTGQSKAHGLPTHDEGRLPPPDINDAKNGDEKVTRPSCPNGNKELRYSDGRSVQCLPGKQQCPNKSVCYFNGMDYFCCPTTEDPYDRHVFGGYGGEEARNGYKVFGPLRIRRLMDEVPLRAKRQTSMDRAFNTNPASFNLDSVVAPLRFDAEKPKHVFRAARMRKPTPPRHGNPMCILPLIKGDCDAAHLRYYYDRNSDSCRLFYYSGCQGNANNFGSLEDCQRLCVLGGQIAPAVQADAVTPVSIVSPGQCPNGAPLGGSAPVLCGNSTESIGCPTGFYCRPGPPDICCPGVDPNQKNPVQHGVKVAQEITPKPGVPRSYYKQQLISTPQYMCPDASDPLMAENGMPAVCGAGFDGVKMCPKGYYCAIDGAKGSRLCCPLFGSTAHRIPTESILAPQLPRRNHNPEEIIDRGSLPSDQQLYDKKVRKTLSEATELVAKTTEAPEYDEGEEDDDDDAQHLKMKPGTRHEQLQNEAASQSPKATEISSETGNIDVSKEQPAVEEPAQPTETSAKQANDKSICQLKPTEGRACREDEKAPRTNLHYFYSAKDRRCKLYFYRGCGGNANRFEKKADCEALCLKA